MPKVKLEVVDPIKGLIKAPDFCPYFKVMSREFISLKPGFETHSLPDFVNVVHASICPLCKLCQFVPELDVETSEISETDIEKVLKTIMAHRSLLESLMKQSHYLQRQDRIPLAALLSYATLRDIVGTIFQDSYKDKVLNYFVALDSPICIIAGIPLYFNRKLTRSAVQVVGEVEWQ